ncbi:MAG TPA: MauE/DoxX family redox-associated membrane protein [Flavisolibacter sp.]|nr:MauE/DoxX family redox-associated membrane protein [Flavisolibacter sp.]
MKPLALSKAIDIIAAVFILLFVYTGTSKLITHNRFLITLEQLPIVSLRSTLFSWSIPVTELMVAVLLFIPRLRLSGLKASLVLMAVFTVYVASMLISSSNLPCSCGGIINKLTWQQHLWLNVALTLLAAAAIYFNKRLKFLFE